MAYTVPTQVPYDDEAVWGAEFSHRRDAGRFPWDKVPVVELGPRVVGQSGAIARWAVRLPLAGLPAERH